MVRVGAHADRSISIAQRQMIDDARVQRRLATLRFEQVRNGHDEKADGQHAHRNGDPANLPAAVPIAKVADQRVRKDRHELVDRLKQTGFRRCHIEA